jgi:hypothetical protein
MKRTHFINIVLGLLDANGNFACGSRKTILQKEISSKTDKKIVCG